MDHRPDDTPTFHWEFAFQDDLDIDMDGGDDGDFGAFQEFLAAYRAGLEEGGIPVPPFFDLADGLDEEDDDADGEDGYSDPEGDEDAEDGPPQFVLDYLDRDGDGEIEFEDVQGLARPPFAALDDDAAEDGDDAEDGSDAGDPGDGAPAFGGPPAFVLDLLDRDEDGDVEFGDVQGFVFPPAQGLDVSADDADDDATDDDAGAGPPAFVLDYLDRDDDGEIGLGDVLGFGPPPFLNLDDDADDGTGDPDDAYDAPIDFVFNPFVDRDGDGAIGVGDFVPAFLREDDGAGGDGAEIDAAPGLADVIDAFDFSAFSHDLA